MQDSLRQESARLARSWLRHHAAMLRDYLVSGVEDPRINLQSIFSRHFLIRALAPADFSALMEQEHRFSAVMNWLVGFAGKLSDADEPAALLHALRHGADNAEGLEIPRFVIQTFAALPALAGDLQVPNYIENFLSGLLFEHGRAILHQPSFDTFSRLWARALLSPSLEFSSSRREEAHTSPGSAIKNQSGTCGTRFKNPPHPHPTNPLIDQSTNPPIPLSVLEPACGSANDYRFLHAYGIARHLDYTGFDLCETNIQNACALFPCVRFEVGNVFEIPASDKSFDICLAHDLFEHFSLEGLQAAIKELCRVTRLGLCIGFFNMDEISDHFVQSVDEYHWNKLSMARTRELFACHGFAAQVIHIGTFLRQQIGCEETHNANAYTFLLKPA